MSLTLQEIAVRIGATVDGDPQYRVSGVADLKHATAFELSFFSNPRYRQQMVESRAGAIIVPGGVERPEGKNYLVHENPSGAFQVIVHHFLAGCPPLTGFSGVHPTAVIHPGASIGKGVSIGPYAVVDQEAIIGDRTFLGAFTFIGPRTRVGNDCAIHPHVTIREGCILGDRVIIQPGAVIGSCGYGYLTGTDGRHTKLEQLGNVVIENDVEIGANTTVDRARFQSTVIREGTKIDNQVQVAHNVEIGRHSLIVAQVGIAGSARLGNHVVLGGQTAVNGHTQIGDGVRVAACSGVSKSLPDAGDYGGIPVQPLAEYNRNAVYLRRINDLYQRVKALEETIR